MAKTTLIYGNPDTFKTSNLGYAARYLFEKSGGKPVRLISSDGGQYDPIRPYIDAGIIEPLWIIATPEPLYLWRYLSLGYWPVEMKDHQMVGVKMIEPGPKNDLSKYSGYLVEGLTSISDSLLVYVREKGKMMREQTDAFKIAGFAGEITVSANSMTHYNVVQQEVRSCILRFAQLPVERVIFSGHEYKGEEEGTGDPIRGPMLAGKAMTGKIAKDLGTVVHFESFETETEQEAGPGKKIKVRSRNVRAYFRSHSDPKYAQTFYPAKTKLPPTKIDELLKRFPGGYFTPGKDYGKGGLDEYLRVEDELSAGGDAGLADWVKAIKGGK